MQSQSELEAAFKKVRGRPAGAEDDKASPTQRKSSTFSTHRISDTSNGDLDNINLDASAHDVVEIPLYDKGSKTISLSSITNALPSMPWSPPVNDSPTKNPSSPIVTAAAPVTVTAPAPAPTTTTTATPTAPTIVAPSRKLTSPFSWLSRNSVSKEVVATPPPTTSPRRNTASSVATLTSNPEMMLSKLEEEKNGEVNGINGAWRNSLKDRFKIIRMREEAGIASLPGEEDKTAAGVAGGPAGKSPVLGLVIPTGSGGDDRDYGLAMQAPPSPIPPSPNPSLAPGTASGVSAGPSTISDVPVDWDLWQAVIYEGPAAVARSSAEELNKAIATGIPSAIRGVIWQVLAQSQNEGLEVVYKELVALGTDKEKDRHSNGSGNLSIASNLSTQKEPVSSRSSIHSEHSGPNGGSSPTEKDLEAIAKAQAAATAERKKKDKEDSAMLQKLEKAIRRDIGTRTSYSKFAAAQGLQESLFGACKAYALFDEGVGYAQGMNFLVMPLLFNVSLMILPSHQATRRC